jgi:hypothetical protein
MGKQSRSKRHRHGGKGKPAPNSDDGSSEKAPALLQRLRHADEGTRQAALVALEMNPALLSASSSSSSSSHHRDRLLEAVRDQLMGSSLEVSTQACAVMVSYLSSASFNEDLAASWLNLLVQRLQTCLDRLRPAEASGGGPTSASTSHQKLLQRRQIMCFAARCLECVAMLIEVNPLATRRIVRSQVDVLSVLHPWLEVPGSAQEGDGSTNEDRIELCELACQCLHSVLDDNQELVSPWFENAWERQTCHQTTLRNLETVLTTDPKRSSSATSVSPLAQLHAAGAWLSIWRLIPSGGSVQTALVTSLQSHLDTCVGILVDALADLDGWIRSTDADNSLSVMLRNIDSAHAEWIQLRQDAKLENEVVASQCARRESARSIARRHKKRSDEEALSPPPPPASSTPSAATATATAMVVEPDGDEMEEAPRAEPSPASAYNPQDEWETAQAHWHTKVRPFQLCLEILLNVTSVGDDAEDEEEEESGDARMDDADGPAAALDDALAAALLDQRRLPDVVQRVLASVTAALLLRPLNTSCAMVPESLGDLVHKAGTLLGHASANLPSWAPPATLWNDLLAYLQQLSSSRALELEGTLGAANIISAPKRLVTPGFDEAVEGITTALVMGVQSKRLRCSQLEVDVSNLLPVLRMFSSNAVQRNLVCLIGSTLCAEPSHPEHVNEQVCRALLDLLDTASALPSATSGDSDRSSATMVMAEACNALMDLYGGDDEHCHRAVYDRLGVPARMERTVPLLRRGGEAEAAMNAKRFVQYMKEQQS